MHFHNKPILKNTETGKVGIFSQILFVFGNSASSAVRGPCGALAPTRTWGASCCQDHSHQEWRFAHYMSPIHHEWGPHTSSHARVKYEVPAKLQSPTGQALGPKKTSVPPAPQTRRLRVLDQCRALRPSVDLVRTAAAASAHSAVSPARLRAVSAGNQDTDPTYPVSSQRPTAMATVHRASRSGPRAQDRNTGQARPGRKKREQAEKSSWGAPTESLLEGGSGKYELLSIKLGPLHKVGFERRWGRVAFWRQLEWLQIL